MATMPCYLVFLIQLFIGFIPCQHISDQKLCADSKCQETISMARTIRGYKSRDSLFLEFDPGETVRVTSKSAGSRPDLWGGEMNNGKRGYFPRIAVTEYKVVASHPEFLISTATGRPLNEGTDDPLQSRKPPDGDVHERKEAMQKFNRQSTEPEHSPGTKDDGREDKEDDETEIGNEDESEQLPKESPDETKPSEQGTQTGHTDNRETRNPNPTSMPDSHDKLQEPELEQIKSDSEPTPSTDKQQQMDIQEPESLKRLDVEAPTEPDAKTQQEESTATDSEVEGTGDDKDEDRGDGKDDSKDDGKGDDKDEDKGDDKGDDKDDDDETEIGEEEEVDQINEDLESFLKGRAEPTSSPFPPSPEDSNKDGHNESQDKPVDPVALNSITEEPTVSDDEDRAPAGDNGSPSEHATEKSDPTDEQTPTPNMEQREPLEEIEKSDKSSDIKEAPPSSDVPNTPTPEHEKPTPIEKQEPQTDQKQTDEIPVDKKSDFEIQTGSEDPTSVDKPESTKKSDSEPDVNEKPNGSPPVPSKTKIEPSVDKSVPETPVTEELSNGTLADVPDIENIGVISTIVVPSSTSAQIESQQVHSEPSRLADPLADKRDDDKQEERNDGTAPSNDGTMPSNDGTAPSNDGTAPSNDGTAPSNDGTMPSNDGTVPSYDGTVPSTPKPAENIQSKDSIKSDTSSREGDQTDMHKKHETPQKENIPEAKEKMMEGTIASSAGQGESEAPATEVLSNDTVTVVPDVDKIETLSSPVAPSSTSVQFETQVVTEPTRLPDHPAESQDASANKDVPKEKEPNVSSPQHGTEKIVPSGEDVLRSAWTLEKNDTTVIDGTTFSDIGDASGDLYFEDKTSSINVVPSTIVASSSSASIEADKNEDSIKSETDTGPDMSKTTIAASDDKKTAETVVEQTETATETHNRNVNDAIQQSVDVSTSSRVSTSNESEPIQAQAPDMAKDYISVADATSRRVLSNGDKVPADKNDISTDDTKINAGNKGEEMLNSGKDGKDTVQDGRSDVLSENNDLVTEPSKEVTQPPLEVTQPSKEVTQPPVEVTLPPVEVKVMPSPEVKVMPPPVEAKVTERPTEVKVMPPPIEATEPTPQLPHDMEDVTLPSPFKEAKSDVDPVEVVDIPQRTEPRTLEDWTRNKTSPPFQIRFLFYCLELFNPVSHSVYHMLPPTFQDILDDEPSGLPPITTITVVIITIVASLILTITTQICRVRSRRKAWNVLESYRILDEKYFIATKENENFMEANTSLEQKAAEYLTEMKSIQEKEGNYKNEIKTLKKSNSSLEKAKLSIQEELTQLKELTNQQSWDLKTSLNENSTLKNEVGQMEDHVSALEQQLQESQEALSQNQATVSDFHSQIQQLTAEVDLLTNSKEQLTTELEGWGERVSDLTDENGMLKNQEREMKESIAFKDNELEVLKDCFMQIKTLEAKKRGTDEGGDIDDDSVDNSEINEKVKSMVDVAKIRAEFQAVEDDRDRLQNQLKIEIASRKAHEEKIKSLQIEMENLREGHVKAEQQSEDAIKKLNVLSNYFKEKELKLQRELGEQEHVKNQSLNKLSTADERSKMMEDEMATYKKQVDELKEEIANIESTFRTQVSVNEKKAHDNWLAARAAERELQQQKNEASTLRQKLMDTERKLHGFDQDRQLELRMPPHDPYMDNLPERQMDPNRPPVFGRPPHGSPYSPPFDGPPFDGPPFDGPHPPFMPPGPPPFNRSPPLGSPFERRSPGPPFDRRSLPGIPFDRSPPGPPYNRRSPPLQFNRNSPPRGPPFNRHSPPDRFDRHSPPGQSPQFDRGPGWRGTPRRRGRGGYPNQRPLSRPDIDPVTSSPINAPRTGTPHGHIPQS